jgi:hypothetical protein
MAVLVLLVLPVLLVRRVPLVRWVLRVLPAFRLAL